MFFNLGKLDYGSINSIFDDDNDDDDDDDDDIHIQYAYLQYTICISTV